MEGSNCLPSKPERCWLRGGTPANGAERAKMARKLCATDALGNVPEDGWRRENRVIALFSALVFLRWNLRAPKRESGCNKFSRARHEPKLMPMPVLFPYWI